MGEKINSGSVGTHHIVMNSYVHSKKLSEAFHGPENEVQVLCLESKTLHHHPALSPTEPHYTIFISNQTKCPMLVSLLVVLVRVLQKKKKIGRKRFL